MFCNADADADAEMPMPRFPNGRELRQSRDSHSLNGDPPIKFYSAMTQSGICTLYIRSSEI